MTSDGEKIAAVTHVLTGEFHVGQSVRVNMRFDSIENYWHGRTGVVKGVDPKHIGVDLGEHSDGEIVWFHREYVVPL